MELLKNAYVLGSDIITAIYSASTYWNATTGCAENLHFMLNGETRRSPRLPDAHAQMAWEDVDKVS
jgi:hypothetical protein